MEQKSGNEEKGMGNVSFHRALLNIHNKELFHCLFVFSKLYLLLLFKTFISIFLLRKNMFSVKKMDLCKGLI